MILYRPYYNGVAYACAVAVRSRLARDASVCRFDADSSTFLSRIDCGVTSTASSSRMTSSDCSSDSGRGLQGGLYARRPLRSDAQPFCLHVALVLGVSE